MFPWIVTASALAGEPLLPRTPLQTEPLYAFDGARSVAVKWRDGLEARVEAGGVRFGADVEPAAEAAVEQILAGAGVEPWARVPEATLRALEVRAERRSGRTQPDLAGIHRVTPPDASPGELLALARSLDRLALVEFVEVEHGLVPPPADYPPVTADHEGEQGHLGPDPGFDVSFAWSEGLTGIGVTVRDCEYDWLPDHEDLVDGDIFTEVNQTPDSPFGNDHGTAVAGIVVGQDNGYGMTGIAPGARFGLYPEVSLEEGSRRSTAVTNAIADSVPGELVLLEMQTTGPEGVFVPAEHSASIWTVVRLGVDAGITVVAAAGNGGADLDTEPYEPYRMRGDSGAIIVGASTPDLAHARYDFSTHGQRLDVNAWGRRVFTLGEGDFVVYGDDPRQAYTDSFSGTSSASALISGVAALLLEASLRYRPSGMEPDELRQLLVDTGIPSDERIGSFPDLRAALLEMDTRLDVVPTILPSAPPGYPAGRVAEGEEVEITVEARVLPTHTPRFEWTLPDGSRVEGPSLVYAPPDDGPVTIGVEVFDEWERSAGSAVSFDAVNVRPSLFGPPVAEGEGREGTPIEVSVVPARDPGEDTIEYEWTVDGETLRSAEPAVALDLPQGSHVVEVVAIDDDGGASNPERTTLVVTDVPPSLEVRVPAGARAKDEVELSVVVTDPGVDDVHTVQWDLGDGATATGEAVRHAWNKRGEYPIAVTVTDQDGVSVTEPATIVIGARSGLGCTSSGPVGGGLGGWLGLWLLRRRRRDDVAA